MNAINIIGKSQLYVSNRTLQLSNRKLQQSYKFRKKHVIEKFRSGTMASKNLM